MKRERTKYVITVYYNKYGTSDKQVIEWFSRRGIQYIKKRIERITKDEIMNLLIISEQGFEDILRKRTSPDSELSKIVTSVDAMTINESLDLIINKPKLLKSPIIYEGDKLMVGYNSEEIRKFIPREFRKIE